LLLDALQQFSQAESADRQDPMLQQHHQQQLEEGEEASSRGQTLHWVLCIRLLLSSATGSRSPGIMLVRVGSDLA